MAFEYAAARNNAGDRAICPAFGIEKNKGRVVIGRAERQERSAVNLPSARRSAIELGFGISGHKRSRQWRSARHDGWHVVGEGRVDARGGTEVRRVARAVTSCPRVDTRPKFRQQHASLSRRQTLYFNKNEQSSWYHCFWSIHSSVIRTSIIFAYHV